MSLGKIIDPLRTQSNSTTPIRNATKALTKQGIVLRARRGDGVIAVVIRICRLSGVEHAE